MSHKFETPPEMLISRLSFSHIRKILPISHENLGQLNAYVGYYKENEMYPGDNPPVGILLCTRKGKKMVEYALSGMDSNVFVSTYQLKLPDKKQLEDFLIKEIDELGLNM